MVDSLNARPKDRPFFVKWLEIPMVQVPQSEFPGFPQDCKILRSKCKLPRPLRANSTQFDFIGKLNRMTTIPLKPSYQILSLMESEYTGNTPRATEQNDYIYVFSTLNLTGIAVAMIPEDVEEYIACCVDCTMACPTDDEAYAVSSDLQQRIIQAALSTELRIPTLPKTEEVEIDGK